jgi:hypothetical protein
MDQAENAPEYVRAALHPVGLMPSETLQVARLTIDISKTSLWGSPVQVSAFCPAWAGRLYSSRAKRLSGGVQLSNTEQE